MTAALETINCTQCGAGLSVLGGHRVRVQVCGYCGAVLDRQADYRVLQRYRDLERPSTPFEIGMSGTVKGVEFVIIGIIGKSTVQNGETYRWVDHQLYSPTHGYGWLTVNAGHCIFTRRIRQLPSPAGLGRLRTKAKVHLGEQVFRKLESYDATTDFCEGEFTWVPALGDVDTVDEAIAPPLTLARVTRATDDPDAPDEIEYELGEYLDPEATRASFGAAPASARPRRIHPAQPFRPGRLHDAVALAGGVFFSVPLFLYWVLSSAAGEATVYQQVFDDLVGPHQFEFTVSRPDQLVEIDLEAPLRNTWLYYNIELATADGDDVAEFGREIAFYSGYDGESWSEGSQTSTARFKLPAGVYRAGITLEEAEDRASAPSLPSGYDRRAYATALGVKVREGVIPFWPLGLVAGLFALSGLSLPARRFLFERRRWGDYDDDD